MGAMAITPAERKRQKKIYAQGLEAGTLGLGFSTFFLNRTNHSGILNGGMIGGKAQTGDWKLDARFNRSEAGADVNGHGGCFRRRTVTGVRHDRRTSE